MDLTQQTPAQIDAALAEVNLRVQRAESRRDSIEAGLERARKHGWRTEDGEAALAEAEAALAAVVAETAPYHAEYWRRGRWSRFYLVTSSDGHIHSSTSCSTCGWGTTYAWLPDVSGLTEAEAVAIHGERLCSVCFPSAPVEWRDRYFAKRDEAAKAERAAKAAAKAAKDAASITCDWTEFGRTKPRVFKTELGAERAGQAEVKSFYTWGETHPAAAEWLASAQAVAEALADRRGIDPQELLDAWHAKGKKAAGK